LQNQALSACSFRLRRRCGCAIGAHFIATAFTLEIQTAIYPIILFGDLRWMDLSWHGSREKTGHFAAEFQDGTLINQIADDLAAGTHRRMDGGGP